MRRLLLGPARRIRGRGRPGRGGTGRACGSRRPGRRSPPPVCRRPAPPRSSASLHLRFQPRATCRSSSRRPTSITSSSSRAGRSEGVWVPYDEAAEQTIRDDFQPAVGHQLPRQPVDRDRRRALRERRGRQAGRLQHGGAAAGQDRRLRRLEQGRAHQDRREAEGSAASSCASTRSSTTASCAGSRASSGR